MATQQTVAGGRLALYINGLFYGAVTDWSYQSVMGRSPIGGIDIQNILDIRPGQKYLTGSFSVVRLQNSAGLEGAGVVAPFDLLDYEQYISVLLLDLINDLPLLQVDRGLVMAQNWQGGAKAVTTGSFSWIGLGWANEY